MQAAETRVDPADGNAYTREDFVAQYGGTVEWDAAGAKLEAERRAAAALEQQRLQAMSAGGKRIDMADGNAYTRDEFIEAYGGTVEWDAAQPVGGGGALGATPAAAAPVAAPAPMSRAEQIKAKQAEQRARVQAIAQAKADAAAAAAAEPQYDEALAAFNLIA